MTRTTRALLVLVALLGSCAGQKGGIKDGDRQRDLKNEITALEQKIIDWRKEAGLAYRPAARFINQTWDPFKTKPQAAKCNRCGDVCDLTDYICGAAEDICRIAKELPGDDWAADKCRTATASCREAKQNCEKCRCTAADSP